VTFTSLQRASPIRYSLPMPRQSRAASRDPEPSYPAWRAAAVKALQKLHERAARVPRERIWPRAYIMRLEPAEAADVAAREYDATHPPAWVKMRW
jgi:hypothetical protein